MRFLLACIALLPLVACSSMGKPKDPIAATAHPFDPVTLRIHPLTHVDSTGPKIGPDQCLLVLHFELRDRYGDLVKGLGHLQVEMYKPGAGVSPGIETQALPWAPPGMDDPAENSGRFDTSTRSYRLPLSSPRWVYDWLKPENAADRGGSPGWLKVRVTLTVKDADGNPRLLTDEYVIQG